MKNNHRIHSSVLVLFRLMIVSALMVGAAGSGASSYAVSLTWTNGSSDWTSTTAWQTNVFDSLTNSFTYFYTNLPSTVVTNFCTITNTVTPGTFITIITNCTPGGLDATCQISFPPGFTAGTPCVGGTGGFPSSGDQAVLTNAGPYTVRVNSPISDLMRLSVSNSLVTIDAASSLSVTGQIRIGYGNGTATVYLAGGTLDYQDNSLGLNTARIGNDSSSGTLIVTNGTVVSDNNLLVGASSTAVGKLVVSGLGVVSPGGFGGSLTVGSGSGNSSCIVTGGGKVVLNGIMRLGSGSAASNNLILISGSTSVWSNWGGTAGLQMGSRGNTLIVSNGAKLWCDNGATIGNASSYNTGIVVGVGSTLFSGGGVGANKVTLIGSGSAGSTNNCLIVTGGALLRAGGNITLGNANPSVSNALVISDGGALFSSGTMEFGKSGFGHTVYMGGVGAVSTGSVFIVGVPNGSTNNSMIVSNAMFTCSQFNIRSYGNSLSVLSNGTLILNHDNGTPANATSNDVLNVTSYNNGVTINGGTINAVGGSRVFTVAIGNSSTLTGSSLIITNGGKLLSEQSTIGAGNYNTTGIVTGAGSVWSNSTPGYVNTNTLIVGAGAGGSNNYFAVLNGASLFNNGTFNIGNNTNATGNTVVFGEDGAPVVIVNTGSLNIGSGAPTYGNSLTVSNASLNCGTLNVGGTGGAGNTPATNNSLVFSGGTIAFNFMRVRPTNTVTFRAGTISAGAATVDATANNGQGLVVGDGVSTAYYDMVAGGSSNHDFSAGLVVTNGAYLRGSGTLLGNVTVLGTFAPGFSVGTVVAGNNLTFGTSAVLNYDLGTLSDSVSVYGDLALGTSTVIVANSGGFAATEYTLFTHTNTTTAPSGTLTVGSLPAGFSAVVSNDLATSRVLLVVSAVVVTDPYASWLSHYSLSGGSAAGTADPDGDGMSNTNEFLAGFNPTNNAAYLHVISVAKSGGGTNMTVTYLGADGDSTWSPGVAARTNVLQFATGTANGSYSNNFLDTGVSQVLSNGSGGGAITNMVDSGGGTNVPSRYYRVKVLVP